MSSTRVTATFLQKSGFALIDLRFQAWAVLKHTQGWSPDELLAWMEIFGEVGLPPTEPEGSFYGFKSEFGPVASFRFEPDGHLLVMQGRREPPNR